MRDGPSAAVAAEGLFCILMAFGGRKAVLAPWAAYNE